MRRVARGTLDRARRRICGPRRQPKGEFVVVVAPPEAARLRSATTTIVDRARTGAGSARASATPCAAWPSGSSSSGAASTSSRSRCKRGDEDEAERVRAYRRGLLAETIAACCSASRATASSPAATRRRSARSTWSRGQAARLRRGEAARRRFEDAGWTRAGAARRRIARAAQYWLAGHPDLPATTSASTWCSLRLGLAALYRQRVSRLTPPLSIPA